MDHNSLRSALMGFCGEQRYRQFLRALVDSARSKHRLLFWQEQLWTQFTAAHPEYAALSFAETEAALRICHLHLVEMTVSPLVPERADSACVTPSPLYMDARNRLFPCHRFVEWSHASNDPRKAVLFSCPLCVAEHERWRIKHVQDEALHGLRGVLASDEGELTVIARLDACFTTLEHSLCITWKNKDATVQCDGRSIPANIGEALDLVRRVMRIALEPDVPLGSGSTTWYTARMFWRFTAPVGKQVEDTCEFRSRDLPPQEIEHILKTMPHLRERIPTGARARSFELFQLVEDVCKQG